jgi:hypothetical protein
VPVKYGGVRLFGFRDLSIACCAGGGDTRGAAQNRSVLTGFFVGKRGEKWATNGPDIGESFLLPDCGSAARRAARSVHQRPNPASCPRCCRPLATPAVRSRVSQADDHGEPAGNASGRPGRGVVARWMTVTARHGVARLVRPPFSFGTRPRSRRERRAPFTELFALRRSQPYLRDRGSPHQPIPSTADSWPSRRITATCH